MFDRRSESEIQREIQAEKATRLGQLAAASRELLDVLGTYTRIIEIVIALSIIAIVASLLWPRLIKARHAAYVTTCLEPLNQLGLAMEMYNMDYRAYPPAETWHETLRSYLGPLESKAAPFKCAADRTSDPTSYYYLPVPLLPRGWSKWPSFDTPMLVDELHHPFKTTILWYDGHQSAIDKLEWVRMRREKYQIRRDLDHAKWLRFVPSPGETAEATSGAAGG